MYAAGSSCERSTPDGSKNGGTICGASGLFASRTTPSRSGPSSAESKSAAVGRLSITSPAFAIASVSTQAVASAPATTSSRCTPPTRKKWNVPACMPTDICRRTGPAEVDSRRIPARASCIPSAAVAARCAWFSPRKRSSTASPPNLSRSAWWAYAAAISSAKAASSTVAISSAPSRPRFASFSVSSVKPETSANTSVPSNVCARVAGASRSQSAAMRGTKGRSGSVGVPGRARAGAVAIR